MSTRTSPSVMQYCTNHSFMKRPNNILLSEQTAPRFPHRQKRVTKICNPTSKHLHYEPQTCQKLSQMSKPQHRLRNSIHSAQFCKQQIKRDTEILIIILHTSSIAHTKSIESNQTLIEYLYKYISEHWLETAQTLDSVGPYIFLLSSQIWNRTGDNTGPSPPS